METSEDIFLLPSPDLQVNCHLCSHESVDLGDYVFQGIHIIGKYNCPACAGSFFQTLPVGHDLLFPMSFDDKGKRLKTDPSAEQWLVRPLLDSFFKNKKLNV